MKYQVRAIARQDIIVEAKDREEAEFLARESDNWDIYAFEIVENEPVISA